MERSVAWGGVEVGLKRGMCGEGDEGMGHGQEASILQHNRPKSLSQKSAGELKFFGCI